MYFILIGTCVSVITLLIVLKVFIKPLLVQFVQSHLGVRYTARISHALSKLMMDLRNECFAFLVTLFAIRLPNEDEPLDQFVGSPVRTCPPTEYVSTPPKEEISTTETDNNNNMQGPRNRPARRRAPRVRLIRPVAPVPEEVDPEQRPLVNRIRARIRELRALEVQQEEQIRELGAHAEQL